MGRHGGGSRSGGSRGSSSSHRSGSRSGGSSVRTSSTPFIGCYNRSYYDRRGCYHPYYTSDINFGQKSGSFGIILLVLFLVMHMSVFIFATAYGNVSGGSKIDGPKSRVGIVDTIDYLSDEEEEEILQLFFDVYSKSGMPITLFTDNLEWRDFYDSIEVYSEELYYHEGLDESSMIILFTTGDVNGEVDWEYDFYCGDDTYDCLSDDEFDTLLANFHKAMLGRGLTEALSYSWNSVIDDMASTEVNWLPMVGSLLGIGAFYSIFFVAVIGGSKRNRDAYKYFKDNPQELSMEPMHLYNKCPACGASNSEQLEKCPYCDTLLKLSGNGVEFVDPN